MNNEPISLSVALGGLLSTGVALVAVFAPDLSQAAQIAIIAFGNAVILTGSVLYARANSTPTANPTLTEGTVVNVTTPAGMPNTQVTLQMETLVIIVIVVVVVLIVAGWQRNGR